jgi:multisubunit Na+/H+ antiporter MnhF subunit
MTSWLLAMLALLPPLLIPLAVALRGDLAQRFVAVQLATNVTMLILVLSSFAFSQPPLIDLPLTLALLSLPATLMFALFVERWL